MEESLDNAPHGVEKENRPYEYDAVIVLGGGIHRADATGEFRVNDYRNHQQEFGTLDGGMRMVAAMGLYREKASKNFVFTGGVSEKTKEEVGDDAPTEASVYGEKFKRVVNASRHNEVTRDEFIGLEEPTVIEEDHSVNTASQLQEVLQLIKDNGWKNVSIVSSDYHIPRAELLYNMALEQHPEVGAAINFVSAEAYAREHYPGKYDDVIDRYAQTPEMQTRIANEQQGVADIRAGRYHLGEFQLRDAA